LIPSFSAVLDVPDKVLRVEELHTTIAAMLRDAGQRYTRSRRAVVEVLAEAKRPLTLPEILDSDAALAQSSAYRNLAELVEAGVVRRIITSDEHSHFELEEHLTGEHHHHLICGGCGAVTDFVVPPELEQLIDRAASTVGRQQRFQVDHHRFDLLGRCAACG
jgi:Fe2+ or Zn2+ uptake regulation protein